MFVQIWVTRNARGVRARPVSRPLLSGFVQTSNHQYPQKIESCGAKRALHGAGPAPPHLPFLPWHCLVHGWQPWACPTYPQLWPRTCRIYQNILFIFFMLNDYCNSMVPSRPIAGIWNRSLFDDWWLKLNKIGFFKSSQPASVRTEQWTTASFVRPSPPSPFPFIRRVLRREHGSEPLLTPISDH